MKISKEPLEELYFRYNRREWVHPDPVEFLYNYDDPLDREVVGMIASSLAYGRVAQIYRSITGVLDRMNPSPHELILNSSDDSLLRMFKDFKHRFTTGMELAALLIAVKQVKKEFGSLENCFLAGFSQRDEHVLSALSQFVGKLRAVMGGGGGMFMPAPCGGSACKRLHLFLRWMIRSDDVDPGGWKSIPPSHLIVPLDTHMHRIGVMLGFTSRRQADLNAALEVTEAFKQVAPQDPVRYDFALTRAGILNNEEIKEFLRGFAVASYTSYSAPLRNRSQKTNPSRTTPNIPRG